MSTRKGFTLIELLVVISIIGLLTSIVLPSLNEAKNMARRTACRAGLHSVAIAFRMYLNESDDVLPVAAAMPSKELTKEPRIVDVLEPYLSGPGNMKCPADTVKKYYLSEGSSYEYNTMLGGKKVGDSFMTRWLGEARTRVMNDYEPFHGPAGKKGSASYLFADCHVGDLE